MLLSRWRDGDRLRRRQGAQAATTTSAATAASGLTAAGFALGTPAYMAPEQAVGDPATDARADLYAFGAMA